MDRIIYPEEFSFQLLLFKTLLQTHADLGLASPLTAFLLQQNIDLAADETAGQSAFEIEQNRKKISKEAENHTQKRNQLFAPVMQNLRGYFQYLKRFYKPNFMEVGTWGAPIITTGRIQYPPEIIEIIFIVSALKAKHDTFAPGTSPLDAYLTQHNLSIAADLAAIDLVGGQHEMAKQLAKDAEDATQDRNNLWNPVMAHIRMIGGFLMGLYSTNSKELGKFGFTVDDSPRVPKEVTSKVKLGNQKTVSSLTIGGTFKNIGTVPLHVYKGASASGAAQIVPTGEMMGIAKGWSIITVANPSTTTTGVFSVHRRQ